jgi:hypothetical protein
VRIPKLAKHAVRVAAVPLLLAVPVAGIGPANAAAAGVAMGSGAGPAFLTTGGSLWGAAATSARNAWAAGFTIGGKALILRWNGTAWK